MVVIIWFAARGDGRFDFGESLGQYLLKWLLNHLLRILFLTHGGSVILLLLLEGSVCIGLVERLARAHRRLRFLHRRGNHCDLVLFRFGFIYAGFPLVRAIPTEASDIDLGVDLVDLSGGMLS